ncbi:MAG: carbohydrate binding family 9 domain-containing protein [Gemmatimonadetes bacterium]|nr:carbohydrate binding family 9 domain-containing protein [Gemmatimonadota bacterium]
MNDLARFFLLALAPALLQAQAAREYPGRGAPSATIPRVTEPITLDATLDEPAWDRAARLTDFSQYQPVDRRPAVEATEVRVLYARDAIFFGIIATAADPGSVRATRSKRDNISNDDRVTIYLDTFNDKRRAFFFGANPLGVQVDGVRTEGAASAGNMFGGSVDLNPDFRFETSGRLTPTGYVIEMRIPFKSLRFPSGAQRWGIQVVRNIPSRTAEDTWTDAQRGASSLLAQSGILAGIDDVERGVVTDLQPFITESVTGTRDADGRFGRDGGRFDAGLNARLGFSSFAIEGTVNPDFSQVESDAGLVTINERFTLFLPERRPFFLEGIELFATPNQLVYSRQIANPIAGGKVTGKLGRAGVALLSAVDDAPGDNALFNIARLRGDYGGNSVLGLTVTDRRQGDGSNSVVALDNRLVFRDVYYLETQLGQSFTSAGAGVQSAPVWKAELDRTGRIWGFNYSAYGFGDRFETSAGFVPRVGFQNAHAFNRFAWLGNPTSLIQNFTTFFGPTRLWRYGSIARSAALEGDDQLAGFITLRGGWSLNPSLNRKFFVIDPSVASGLQVSSIEGALVPWDPSTRLDNLWATSLGVTTPVFGRFNASASVSRSAVPIFVEGIEGRQLRVSGSLLLRPSPGTRIEGTLTASRIARAVDGSRFARVVIPRLKAEYQPTRALFFRVVSQYRADRVESLRARGSGLPIYSASGQPIRTTDLRSLRTDWLVQYEPSPGTTAFIGYGDGWGSPGHPDDPDLRRLRDGIFLKIAYLFRR